MHVISLSNDKRVEQIWLTFRRSIADASEGVIELSTEPKTYTYSKASASINEMYFLVLAVLFTATPWGVNVARPEILKEYQYQHWSSALF